MQTKSQDNQCPQCGDPGLLEDGSPAGFCLQCRFPLMLIAGKYRLVRVLARGGSGTLYLAHHKHLLDAFERAVKVLGSNQSELAERRFYREVQLTARASHRSEHIVRIYDDFGVEPFLGYYYVMEYLEGQELGECLKREGAFKLPRALHVMSQLCEAMSAAHEIGVVHRDLKPANIWLLDKGKGEDFIKVLDFGIARSNTSTQYTRPSQGLMGTPLYMSPEQCLGRAVDHRADIYALGIIFYELLTGETPFHVSDDDPESAVMTIIFNHIQKQPTPLLEGWPELDLPPALDLVICKALAKEPEARYEDVEAFWAAIEAAMRNPVPEAEIFVSETPTEPDGLPSLPPPEHDYDSSPDFGPTIVASAFGHPEAAGSISETTPDADWDASHFLSEDDLPDDVTVSASLGEGGHLRDLDLLEAAEQKADQLHLPHGGALLEQLKAQRRELWEIFEQNKHGEIAMALRALLVLSPVVQQNGELPRFVESLRQLLQTPAILPPTLRLRALLAQGSSLRHLGRLDEASKIIADALTMAATNGTPALRGQLLNQLGSIHRVQGNYEDARSLFQEALGHVEAGASPRDEAKILNQLGNLWRLEDAPAEAEQAHRKALALFRKFKDQQGEGVTLAQLGNLLRTMGRQEEAKEIYQDALELHVAQSDTRGEAITRSNLGHILTKQGQLAKALEQYQAALLIFRTTDEVRGEAITLGHLGNLHRLMGLFQAGNAYHQQALELHRSQSDLRGEAISFNHIGTLLRDEGRFEEAAEAHWRAYDLQQKLQDSRGIGLTQFNQSLVFLEQDMLSEADELLEQAKSHLDAKSSQGVLCELHMYKGILYQLAGGTAAAHSCFKQALGQAEELFAPHLEARILCFFGALEASRDDDKKARGALTHAGSIFAQMEDEIGERLVELCLGQSHLAMARKAEANGELQEARSFVRQARALADTSLPERNTDNRLAHRLLKRALAAFGSRTDSHTPPPSSRT